MTSDQYWSCCFASNRSAGVVSVEELAVDSFGHGQHVSALVLSLEDSSYGCDHWCPHIFSGCGHLLPAGYFSSYGCDHWFHHTSFACCQYWPFHGCGQDLCSSLVWGSGQYEYDCDPYHLSYWRGCGQSHTSSSSEGPVPFSSSCGLCCSMFGKLRLLWSVYQITYNQTCQPVYKMAINCFFWKRLLNYSFDCLCEKWHVHPLFFWALRSKRSWFWHAHWCLSSERPPLFFLGSWPTNS